MRLERDADPGTMAAAIATAAALTVLPFLGALPIDFDRLAPLALLPAIWLGYSLRRPQAPQSGLLSLDTGLLGVAGLTALLASIAGPHPAPSITALASLIWAVAAALLARRLADLPQAGTVMLAGITAGATLGCLTVWWQWQEGIAITAFPVYGHGRIFGLHMMVGTIVGLVVFVRSRLRLTYWLAGIAATICCGGLLWSGGRSGLLGVGAGLTLWLWRSTGLARRRILRRTPIVLAGGVVLSLIHWSPESYLGWWGAAARSVAANSVSDLSSTRTDFWRATWQAVKDAPWIGHGADAYRYLVPKLDGDQPHNWILQALLDFGFTGGGAIAILLVRQAWHGFASRSQDTMSSGLELRAERLEPTSIGVAAAFAACLVTGLLDGVFYHAVVLVPAAVLGGMAGRGSGQRSAVSGQRSARAERTSAVSDQRSPVSQLSALNSQLPIELASRRAISGKRSAVSSVLSALSSKLSAPGSQLSVLMRFAWLPLGLSAAVLAIHSYLVFHLWYLPAPVSPDSTPARLLRRFPSTTIGIDAWLNKWREKDDSAALEWAVWAGQHSQAPARLHVLAAVIYADHDDFVSADREMELAEKTVHWTALENVKHMRESIREAARAKR